MKVKVNKVNYKCSKCNFKWSGHSDTFEKVIIHERTHVRKESSAASDVYKRQYVLNVQIHIMNNVWVKLECLTVLVNSVIIPILIL